MGAKVIAPKTPTNIKSISAKKIDDKMSFDAQFWDAESKNTYQVGNLEKDS